MRKNEIKVAIIDNSIDSSVYNPIDHWRSYLDVAWEAFRASQKHFPDLKRGYTHIILTQLWWIIIKWLESLSHCTG